MSTIRTFNVQAGLPTLDEARRRTYPGCLQLGGGFLEPALLRLHSPIEARWPVGCGGIDDLDRVCSAGQVGCHALP